MDIQPGDVPRAYADTQRLEVAVGYKPAIHIDKGMQAFVDWFKKYYTGNEK